jgi:hypothetical protein
MTFECGDELICEQSKMRRFGKVGFTDRVGWCRRCDHL